MGWAASGPCTKCSTLSSLTFSSIQWRESSRWGMVRRELDKQLNNSLCCRASGRHLLQSFPFAWGDSSRWLRRNWTVWREEVIYLQCVGEYFSVLRKWANKTICFFSSSPSASPSLLLPPPSLSSFCKKLLEVPLMVLLWIQVRCADDVLWKSLWWSFQKKKK